MNNILVINNELNVIDNEYVSYKDNVITFKKNCDYDLIYENNVNITINVLDNVFVRLFIYSENIDILSNVIYNIFDNGRVLVYKFYANNNVLENVTMNLNGYMSRIDYSFSNIVKDNEKYNFVINHNNSNSISNLSNRSICLDNAKIDYNIDTVVDNGNVNCNMNQDTKVINMGDNKSTIRPNMYISEDDVEARHASVIGTLNEDELFYLMSRGIDYNNSVKLLVKGYIFSNLELDMEKRNKILNIINKYWR